MKKSGRYYPLFMNIENRKCVVVGGGPVALRKVKKLLEYGAEVTVISQVLCPGLASLYRRGKIQSPLRTYQPGDLEQACLAFTATGNSATNREVKEEAGQKGIPVNIADDAVNSGFIVPSSLRRGDITVAVSTGGVSPALARKIRLRLAKIINDDYASLVHLVGEVRAGLKKNGIHTGSGDWQKTLDIDGLLELLKKGERDKAKTMLYNSLCSPSSTETTENNEN